MAYEYITKYDSPNFGYPTGTRGQNKPKEIIIHHWGSDSSTFNGTVSWLCNKASDVSAHFVVEAGKVACLVNWNDAAFHAGDKAVNMASIGIECHPRCSYADQVTVAEVIAKMWKEYGKLPIRGHKDVVATACPGRWYAILDKLAEMAEVVYNGGELPAEEPVDEPEDSGLTCETTLPVVKNGVESTAARAAMVLLKDRGYYNGTLYDFDKLFGPIADAGVKKLQKESGLEQDGIVGIQTWAKLIGG